MNNRQFLSLASFNHTGDKYQHDQSFSFAYSRLPSNQENTISNWQPRYLTLSNGTQNLPHMRSLLGSPSNELYHNQQATAPSSSSSQGSHFNNNSSNQAVTLGTTSNGSLLGDADISNSFGLNFNSSQAIVPAQFGQNVTIVVGGHLGANDTVVGGRTMTIAQGQMLTAAQYAAAEQVVTSGQQTLVLTNRGTASSGLITLEQGQTNSLSSLVVSRNVTVLAVGYTSSSALNVTGTARISGTLDILQSAANTGSTIDFGSLSVGRSGSVTDALSSNMLSSLSGSNMGGYNPPLLFSSSALNLNVVGNVLNSGSIASPSGTLSINAGGSISNITGGLTPAPTISTNGFAFVGARGSAPTQATISGTNVNLTSGTGSFTNTGLIAATASIGNVLFNAPDAKDINIANTNGTIQALNGAINIRAPTYSGIANIALTGGDYLSQQLNLNGGSGAVNVNVGNVTGTINTYAGSAHVTAAAANLILGAMDISGDPTYYNTVGAVTIATSLSFSGQDLAIVANTDIITAAGDGTIDTSSSSGNGGNITMIAGAAFTSSGSPAGVNDTTSTLTITGGSSTGGKIDLNSVSAITSLTSASSNSGSSGGNITLVAYGGSGTGAGTITLPSAVTVTTGGAGSGNNGTVTIIAGATSGTSITTGAITTTGGTGSGGNISLYTAAPSITGSPTITNGALSGGSFTNGSTVAGSMSLGALTAPGTTITLTGGSAVSTGAISDNGTGSASGGTVNITSNSTTAFTIGSSTANSINGAITTTPGGSGTGGAINITNSGGAITVAESIGGTGQTVNLTANGTITVNTGINVGASGGNSNTAVTLQGTAFTTTGTVNVGSGTVTLLPYATSTAINILGASGLIISSSNLSQITANTLIIGSTADTGGITVAGGMTISGNAGVTAGAYNLTFYTGGNFTSAGQTITLGANNLAVIATGL